MSGGERVGTIAWLDLTVPDAGALREFYEAVVGWESSPVGMGDYADFNMTPPGGTAPVAGVCHARGANADLPAAWLPYVRVADLDGACARCVERGGSVVAGPKSAGGAARYAVIRDPAGAFVALYAEASVDGPGEPEAGADTEDAA